MKGRVPFPPFVTRKVWQTMSREKRRNYLHARWALGIADNTCRRCLYRITRTQKRELGLCGWGRCHGNETL